MVQHRIAHHIRVTNPYLVRHVVSQRTYIACTLRTIAKGIVNLVARYTLEEQLNIYAIEIGSEVDTIGYIRERVAYIHLVVIVTHPIAVLVCIARIARMHRDSLCGVTIHAIAVLINVTQVLHRLFICAIDSLVVVAVESAQRHAKVRIADIIALPQLRTAVQRSQFIVRIRDITTNVIVHLAHRVIMVERQFKALVADIAHIAYHHAYYRHVSYMRRRVHIEQRILGITTEIIHRTRQFAVPEREVYTRIPLLVRLPFAVLVGLAQYGSTRLQLSAERITVEPIRRTVHLGDKCIVVHPIVAYLTKAGTYLQVIQPHWLRILDKRLLAQSPSHSHRWEVAPRILREARRRIRTEVRGNHITAIVVIERTSEE